MKIGLKITLKDPANPANIINAQFATVRGNPQLKDLLQKIADLDVAENIALKKLSLAAAELDAAEDAAAVDALSEKLKSLRHAADNATCALLEATRAFIVAGFALAGASDERAEDLTDAVGIENIQELKAKCLFGAGCLDFTQSPARN